LEANNISISAGNKRLTRWFFAFFFVSGLCSILYEIIWLRLAMAQFGVTSALVSIVLSTFMTGLGLGSWASGRLLGKHAHRLKAPALRWYALTELLIGTSALLVPVELVWGRRLLERSGLSSSGAYYLGSGMWIALTLIPWCACMGATIPLGMKAIRDGFAEKSRRSFSFLYLANVLGAVAGTVGPLVLIELYGFRGALKVGAALNGLLAVSAMMLSLRWPAVGQEMLPAPVFNPQPLQSHTARDSRLLALLFMTGLTSMGIEVVWIRQFTPYLTTVVYAFASILGLYLMSTYIGSQIYRRWSRNHARELGWIWVLVGLFVLLPAITASPDVHLSKLLRLVLGVAPFSGVLGFLTPMLVDRWSAGDPDRAGSAYAVNIIGCIVGPLLSGFLLLPFMSERWVLFVFSLPWLLLGIYGGWKRDPEGTRLPIWRTIVPYAVTALALIVLFLGKGYEDRFTHREVLRDHTATIIATGEGMSKKLLVNGYGITRLTPSTKIMAHLPLTSLDHPPQNALVVCFGMGTTYRSLLSWGIPTTAVELVPSVPRMFWYYHADGPELLKSPLSHVVIDDGRRYLERTAEQYDVITLDPPPPVQAAGSSLLYSKEFYAMVKQRLRPGGILQQWLPYGDAVAQAAVARALEESFPYVRVFHSLDGSGFHFLASTQPIAKRTAADLARRMPVNAVADLMEWGSQPSAESELGVILGSEFPLQEMIAQAPEAPALQDDRPENEYYVLRRWRNKRKSHD
jgi:spermidine synthase